MTAIQISPQDVATAANFLEQFLTDNVPSGDFSQGTALRDLTIGAIAAIYALLTAQNTQVRQMQSLNTVQAAVGGDTQALQDAVTAILSNYFVTPKAGAFSRGVGVGHASQATDIFIPTVARFTYSPGIVFVVDSPSTYFISQNDLIPVIDANGTVLEYLFNIPLVAVNTGNGFDVDPGLFTDFDRFNPYVTRIEVVDKFSGGLPPETVTQMLDRAPTAVSVRNLINDRSIQAVLTDNFEEIQGFFIAGYGDAEMQRDRLDLAPQYMRIHLGGNVDIYLLLALVETTFTGVVGGSFARPDGVVAMFRDASVANFITAGVQVGDIIRITAGLPTVPREFKVASVEATQLGVIERLPFPLATDEQVPPTNVSYTIGRVGPSYSDVLSGVGLAPLTTGVTSRQVSTSGRITLPGGPVMDILDVAITNPPLAEASFKDPTDGYIHFPNHVTYSPTAPYAPTDAQTPALGLDYATIVNNPLYAQSALMWMQIQVGTIETPARFDGTNLRVRYRTLSSFAAIDSFVRGRSERTAAAYQLPRGHNPVSLSMTLSYRLSPSAPALLDNGAIAQTIVDFIMAFDTSEVPIDVSAIMDKVRETYPTISSVLPLTIKYALLAPTGDLITFQSTDLVVMDTAKQIGGPTLDLASYGVSDRTVRYITNTLDIVAQQVA